MQENKTIAEIASEHGVHPNQIYGWKDIALKGPPSLFNDDAKAAKSAQADQEKKLDELYAEIGRLTTQLRWLEKIWPRRSVGLNAWRCSNAGRLNCRWPRSASC